MAQSIRFCLLGRIEEVGTGIVCLLRPRWCVGLGCWLWRWCCSAWFVEHPQPQPPRRLAGHIGRLSEQSDLGANPIGRVAAESINKGVFVGCIEHHFLVEGGKGQDEL